jgi:hypothetical protein
MAGDTKAQQFDIEIDHSATTDPAEFKKQLADKLSGNSGLVDALSKNGVAGVRVQKKPAP